MLLWLFDRICGDGLVIVECKSCRLQYYYCPIANRYSKSISTLKCSICLFSDFERVKNIDWVLYVNNVIGYGDVLYMMIKMKKSVPIIKMFFYIVRKKSKEDRRLLARPCQCKRCEDDINDLYYLEHWIYDDKIENKNFMCYFYQKAEWWKNDLPVASTLLLSRMSRRFMFFIVNRRLDRDFCFFLIRKLSDEKTIRQLKAPCYCKDCQGESCPLLWIEGWLRRDL